MDVAHLGWDIDSKPLKESTVELDKMSKASKRAENSAKGMGAANDNVRKSTDRATVSQGKFTKSLGTLALKATAAVGAVVSLAQVARASVTAFLGFDKALGEVSTLLAGTPDEMAKLAGAARSLSKEFGTTATSQVKAFYQAISAGAETVEDAAEILSVANKLALGGVTSIEIAVDGLTSVMNAYGDAIPNAVAASDAMFVAMKAGKTTIGELSTALGGVAPLAAQVGVSFDELTAATAALTKGGVSTSIAVTGLRAIFAAVVKPTKEAADMAKLLGLEFNATSLQAKGFVGFLQEIADKTGGNVDSLSKLFGGVEALVPALALAGQAGVDFNNIMDDMSVKLGSTDVAADKVASTLSTRLNKELVKLSDNLLPVGNLIVSLVVPALQLLNSIVISVNNGVETLVKHLSQGVTQIKNDINDVIRDFGKLAGLDLGSSQSSSKFSDSSDPNSFNQLLPGQQILSDAKVDRIVSPYEKLKQKLIDLRIEEAFEVPVADLEKSSKSAAKSVSKTIDPWKDLRKEIKGAGKDIDKTNTLFNGFTASITNGLSQGKTVWQSFWDSALNIATNAMNRVIDGLLNNVMNALFQVGNASQSVFGGGGFGGGGGGLTKLITSTLANAAFSSGLGGLFANGGVFNNGNVTAFANGGVVNGPTVFPMANGMGLMGEAGPEAVMPLRRGADGRLGVSASSGAANDNNGGFIRMEILHRHDENGELESFVTKISGQVAGQVVSIAAPGIIEKSVKGSGSALANGDFDQGMGAYNASRPARAR